MTPRITNMLYQHDFTLHLKPQAPETGTRRHWYECAWFKVECLNRQGERVFQGDGLTPDEAINDLLECNAFNIEALCKKFDT